MPNKIFKKQGFTIIEVVLVLAIAGLIFLMVFVALPALQRNQRDTQRREDYAMLESQVISAYSSNGKFPQTATYKIGKDKDGATYGLDPKDLKYNIGFSKTATTLNTLSSDATSVQVKIIHGDNGSYCNDKGKPANYTESEAQPKSFVVYGQLETGTYCRTASV